MTNKPIDNFDIEVISPASEPKSDGVSENASREEKLLASDHEYRTHQQELGFIGKIFGGRHATTYGIVMLGLVSLLGLIIVGSTSEALRAELFKILGGIVIAALAYLGGTHTSQK